ncbi:hypothetical protein HUG15_12850 [Salicibibacter cibarius]|uniref:DUF2802 domain-containing protein n=1 Tax=Salicibibacter cibarius TaxID=2743000 RepID=A0A7T6Z3Z3_9BACI|nr:hypothetical protein [Salicibibacter cibarius]QQK76358.1 hypothetical protein HUG15_12850 [Salicibibacter cibarius]
MIVFVILSVLLHFVSLAAIVYLFQKKAATGDEIERLLKRYTNEMKEDNERLLRQLRPMQAKTPKSSFLSELEQATGKLEKQEKGYEPPEPTGENEAQVTPAAQALRLAQTGKSKQEIAEALSLGHGEVELLLKKHEQR